jgi:hypothetical protein
LIQVAGVVPNSSYGVGDIIWLDRIAG